MAESAGKGKPKGNGAGPQIMPGANRYGKGYTPAKQPKKSKGK